MVCVSSRLNEHEVLWVITVSFARRPSAELYNVELFRYNRRVGPKIGSFHTKELLCVYVGRLFVEALCLPDRPLEGQKRTSKRYHT